MIWNRKEVSEGPWAWPGAEISAAAASVRDGRREGAQPSSQAARAAKAAALAHRHRRADRIAISGYEQQNQQDHDQGSGADIDAAADGGLFHVLAHVGGEFVQIAILDAREAAGAIEFG